MSTPVSLAIKPPSAAAKRKSAWNAPSQRMFPDDSDEEGDAFSSAAGSRSGSRRSKVEEDDRIDGFGSNGRALGSRRSPEPLVIASLPNRDWRQVATSNASALGQRRAPSYRPERREDGPVVTHERVGDEPQRRGLRRAGDVGEEYDRKPDVSELHAAERVVVKTEVREVKEEEEEEDRKPRTLDDEALAAVLAGDTHEGGEDRKAADLVIESAGDRNVFSEEQALERDLNLLPSESTLEDYDAVPVEAFGAAMLRGMGYDPKNDTPMHVPKPRPALLGIGATALSSELPPSRIKDPKKRREAHATRGGRGYNAAGLLVRQGDSRATSTDSRAPSAAASRGASPGEKRRRDDDDERESKRRYEDRDRVDRMREVRGDSTSRRDDRDDRDRERRRDRDRDDRDRRDRDRDRGGRRYETEEERARRKARERERDGRDERDDRRDDDRRRERERDRDRYDDRERRDRDRDRERDRR